MPRKPIKTGIKVFCLVLSIGFLYNWHVFRGSSDPLRGANAMYRLIHDRLMGPIFNHRGCILFCDAAFTTIRLFRHLDKRGIGAVGPMNATKPEKGGNKNSWPHQKFKSTDTEYLGRGWDHTAYSKLDGGGWIQATVWRDNKFVKLLNTSYVVGGRTTCTRWIKTLKEYLDVPTRLVLKQYQKHMGHVDRVDKNVALAAMRLLHCSKRYHRAIFLWLLCAVGFNNVLILFVMLFPLVAVLQRHWKNNGTGFKHWFQQELGNVLIEQGMLHVQKERMDKAANVLIANYRSGVWKSCWCAIRKGKTSTVNVDVRGDRRSKRRSGTGRVGRPAKKKTRRGRPRGSTSGGSRGPGRPRKLSVLEQTRIERFAFCSLPPFVPKQAGRRPTFQSGPTISVRGVMHTLTHSHNVMKPGTSERMWKNEDGRCVCCYAATPSLTASEREANPNRRKKVRKTRYACDKCLVLLCTDCFHNDWSLHKKKPCPIAVRSVYV